jgi:hypothetical protein
MLRELTSLAANFQAIEDSDELESGLPSMNDLSLSHGQSSSARPASACS